MSTGKQTPAPKAGSERKSAASETAKKNGRKDSSGKEAYPKPSQKN
ncbi:hypothetical protein [Flavobacterium cyanobacteriorum]|nr:hypothetical protein [Flavobacterium cyanobacteriorum]